MDDKNLTPEQRPELPGTPGEDDRNATIRTSSHTTRQPSPYPPNDMFDQQSMGIEKLDILSVLIPGNDKPRVFTGQDKLIVGRTDETIKFFPDIDLTPNYGVLMGVSRKHAEISLYDGQYFVQDLYSANGTWLNETKLVPGNTYPLQNGDQLRLGQLLLLIYLSSGTGAAIAEGPPTEDVRNLIVMHITDKSETARLLEDGMAPSYLSDTLGVFLRAIAALQYTIRKAQDKDSPAVMIRRIQVDEAKHYIDVELRNANDIVTFLHGKLPGFVAQHVEKTKIELAQLAQDPTAAPRQPSLDDIAREAAEYMLGELVVRFLNEQRDTYVERIAKILGPIIKSDLRIIRVTPVN